MLIDGLLLTPLQKIAHPRGDILHALKRSAPGFCGFGEAYFSEVLPGAVKGWKRHRRVTLNLIVPAGRIRFVLYDDRPDSGTRGRFDEVTLGPECYARLTVAPALWLAFAGRHSATSLVLNIIEEEHDPAEADSAALEAFEFSW